MWCQATSPSAPSPKKRKNKFLQSKYKKLNRDLKTKPAQEITKIQVKMPLRI